MSRRNTLHCVSLLIVATPQSARWRYSVTFEYHVDIRSYIQIEIFNTIGQKIITLENDWEDGGTHSVCWNARDMSSGVYFSRLSMKVAGANPSLTVVRKVVLVR
jgi:hypothetical protein